jgi:hypothetical protein
LQRILAEQPRGLLYVRDELAGWLGSFNRYGGNGADRAFFLECWNGGIYSNDRVRGPMAVPRNISEFQAQGAGAMGPNQSLLAGWIEPASHEHPSPSYIR